jgi:hypothetical protein
LTFNPTLFYPDLPFPFHLLPSLCFPLYRLFFQASPLLFLVSSKPLASFLFIPYCPVPSLYPSLPCVLPASALTPLQTLLSSSQPLPLLLFRSYPRLFPASILFFLASSQPLPLLLFRPCYPLPSLYPSYPLVPPASALTPLSDLILSTSQPLPFPSCCPPSLCSYSSSDLLSFSLPLPFSS